MGSLATKFLKFKAHLPTTVHLVRSDVFHTCHLGASNPRVVPGRFGSVPKTDPLRPGNSDELGRPPTGRPERRLDRSTQVKRSGRSRKRSRSRPPRLAWGAPGGRRRGHLVTGCGVDVFCSPKAVDCVLGVLNSSLRCVRPFCHCWCPPFSAGHAAFLFICLPDDFSPKVRGSQCFLRVSALLRDSVSAFRPACLPLSPFLLVTVSALSSFLLVIMSVLSSFLSRMSRQSGLGNASLLSHRGLRWCICLFRWSLFHAVFEGGQ